ncbi:MAG TPA: hypothetical protein VM533_09605 [Fimbriiglobus sp.]|jgi:hypothetical protein|nr:hypothetical protein [Fimbriiglobus sp.]
MPESSKPAVRGVLARGLVSALTVAVIVFAAGFWIAHQQLNRVREDGTRLDQERQKAHDRELDDILKGAGVRR